MALQRDNKLFYFTNLTWSLLKITLLNSYWRKTIKLLVKSNPLPVARLYFFLIPQQKNIHLLEKIISI